jgi:hypothetical protein
MHDCDVWSAPGGQVSLSRLLPALVRPWVGGTGLHCMDRSDAAPQPLVPFDPKKILHEFKPPPTFCF